MAKKHNKSKTDYDVLIVGGGMVGASLAVALLPLTIAPLKLKVGLVDAFEFGMAEQPSYDDRSIALSYGSSRIFAGMGLWDELESKTTSIQKIHVSDRGHFGATRLSAIEEKVPALGYLVESRILGKQLYETLADSDIDQIIPASVTATQETEDGLLVTLLKDKKETALTTKLLVAADGTQSKIRELAGIGIKRSDYHQAAVVANVSTEKPHQNQAFERFADSGPIALLPLSDNRCSLVWTHDTKNGTTGLDDTLALDDEGFLKKLGDEFGYRLGKFTKVGKRSSFPLALVTSDKNTAPHTVIIGNASHTMHPVAGQGLNLALRDIAVLADLIAKHADDLGDDELLQAYETQRAGDVKTTVRYTDSLVRLFSNDNFLLGHARAGGLLAVDRLPPLRKLFTRQSMGVNYRQSRLARGLSLRG
ncbi:MAG: 2-octaprenyl-6-methoxyphenyl hydroxylase [Cocleimonas sp.]|nr:2-octaprenyl-6-methoxyphenyl hydroxylase [Cocleimonas sp.]